MPELFCKTAPPNRSAELFVEAVKAGNTQEVEKLLANSEELRSQIDQPWFAFDSPAIVHAKANREMAAVLLDHGANPNSRSQWWAGSFGVLDCLDLESARYFLSRGAELDIHSAAGLGMLEAVRAFLDADAAVVNAAGGDGQRPLHFAKTTEICDLLLDRGADIEARDLDHSATAAQYAATDRVKCRHLIGRGATPDIFMACALGDRSLVETILAEDPAAISSVVGSCRHTKPLHKKSDQHIYFWGLRGRSTPLEVASEFADAELVKFLYEQSPLPAQFAYSCWTGQRDEVDRILKQDPAILSRLSERNQDLLIQAAWDGKIEAVRLMLDVGFDPHRVGAEKSTPLDRASFHGYHEIVDLLLERDPEPPLTVKNVYGGTPLGTCCYGSVHSWVTGTDYLRTAKSLIDAGCTFGLDWIPTGNHEMDELLRSHLEGGSHT